MLAIRTVLGLGYRTKTEDGELVCQMKEPICMHIDYPVPESHPKSLFGSLFMDEYTNKVMGITPLKGNKEDATYTYGNRLRAYPTKIPGVVGRMLTKVTQLFHPTVPEGVDQIDFLVRSLRSSPNTRRAVAITWNPPIDTNTPEPPCLQYIQCTVVDGQLNMVVLFRSHDILSAYGANLYALAVMQRTISDKVGVRQGWMEVISNNAHIYYTRDSYELDRYGIKY